MRRLRTRVYENSLSLTFAALFAVCLAGQMVTGYLFDEQQRTEQHAGRIGFGQWLAGGTFGEAVFVNWQAAVLQLTVLVIAGALLRQIGASHSRDPRRDDEDDDGRDQRERQEERRLPWVRRHSLSLALAACFLAAFVGHVFASTSADNEQHLLSHTPTSSVAAHVLSARFWFETFQTWEAEFGAILVFVVLTIFLREERSAESKPLSAGQRETGETND